MNAASADLAAALTPVRAALRRAARDEVETMLTGADAAAAEILAVAQQRAAELRAEAEAAGIADAGSAIAADRIRGRRLGRAGVLLARREAYERLRAEVRSAVERFAAGPDYPAVRRALVEAAHARLGPDAEITEAPGGGIVARSGGRRLDLSLGALADRAADAVASGSAPP